jgi:hypothetical protein
VIRKPISYQSMNYKETAERLASCGLDEHMLGAVIKELLTHPRMQQSQYPEPDSPWQTGFSDALRFLESEAIKVSAAMPCND